MKFTLANLLLVVLLIAMAVGWWADRRALSTENRQLRHPAALRVRHGFEGMYEPHAEEFKLRGILDRYDLNAIGISESSDALNILAVYESYAQIEDKAFADSFVKILLVSNNWTAAKDLVSALENQNTLTENLTALTESNDASFSQFVRRISKSHQ